MRFANSVALDGFIGFADFHFWVAVLVSAMTLLDVFVKLSFCFTAVP
jgi:hypothetical protein